MGGKTTSDVLPDGPMNTSLVETNVRFNAPNLGDVPLDSAEGVYVGEGLPPIPLKLAKKIRRGEFVEMEELLPELWPPAHQEGTESKLQSKRSRRVTDIFSWIQCFATYASVRGMQAPELIPELMAYMLSIIRVSREYSGLSWVQYDVLFRKHAALKADTKWSVINPTLYARCFTGAARDVVRCELCWAATHETKDCAQQVGTERSLEARLQVIEDSVQVMTHAQQRNPQTQSRPSGEICRKYNNQGCNYPYCRHTHACLGCGGPHPEPQCIRSRRQGYKLEPPARRLDKPY